MTLMPDAGRLDGHFMPSFQRVTASRARARQRRAAVAAARYIASPIL